MLIGNMIDGCCDDCPYLENEICKEVDIVCEIKNGTELICITGENASDGK